jgi:hypothetical protein
MKNKAYLYTLLKRIVAIGNKKDNLYYINATILKRTINTKVDTKTNHLSITTKSDNSFIPKRTIKNSIVNTIKLWYIRLGYMNI